MLQSPQRRPSSDSAASERLPTSRPAPLRVLVVDDDAMQRKLALACLAEAGIEARGFSDVEQALSAARREPPDAILSDVMMNHVDGFSFCRMVRSDAALAHVPVVLTTASFLEPQDHVLAQAVGADALVARSSDLSREMAALTCGVAQRPQRRRRHLLSLRAVGEHYAHRAAGRIGSLDQAARITALKYQTLFENATDAFSMLDTDGVVLDVNRRWEEILQRPREQIIGRHIRDFTVPDHAEETLASHEHAVKEGRALVQVVALARADGTTAYVEVSTVPVDLGEGDVVFAVGRDVTALHETVRKLQLSEQKYRSLIENVPGAVWSAKSTSEVSFVGPHAEEIFGYTPQELERADQEQRLGTVHTDDLPRVRAAMDALFLNGAPLDIEYRRRHKNGSWLWIHNRAQRIPNAEGGTERIDGVAYDVTKHKQVEEQMFRAQKLEAVGQLTGGVAHDFNNILAVIFANVHFVIEALPVGDPRRDDAEEIKHAAERAAGLTRQLLAFSRQQVLTPVDLELDGLVSGVEKMLRRLISEDIRFDIEAGAAGCYVHADSGQVEQVIMNLCVNARDAMPGGGVLRIVTTSAELDGSRDGVPSGRYVRLSVCDSGTGMTDEVKRRVFEPFFTTKGPGKGTGLGLATCYGIIKQSGGFIEIDSSPGHGARFHVYLPRVDAPSTSRRPSMLPAAVSRGDETILLIEDDDVLRSSLTRFLSNCGYEVRSAANAKAAQCLFDEHHAAIDIVVSDVVLPDANGIALLERIVSAKPGLKTVLMSGYTDHAMLERRELDESSNFMHKPFAPKELAARLREVLDA